MILFAGPRRSALAGPQGGQPTCPIPYPSPADPGTFEHRWAGLVFDPFTLDGEEVWTGEDGGRIRHRDGSTGQWSFQSLPLDVQGTIRRIHFLQNGLDGWAVSSDGWVLGTEDGGSTWVTLQRVDGAFGLLEWEDLYDIWISENGVDGWLVGLHGIFYTTDGGICWQLADMLDEAGNAIGANQIQSWHMELYSIDVQQGPLHDTCPPGGAQSDYLGLVCGQPGWIFRSLDDGRTWQIIFDAIGDLCPLLPPGDCLRGGCGHHTVAPWFELWDVEISDHPTDPLVLVVGGVGIVCGLVLSSTDDGCTWSQEFHECDVDPGLNCSTDPAYSGSPRKHSIFKTLYGVAIFDADNTAVAAGYNAQHLRREFLGGNPASPLWRDESEFGAVQFAPQLVTIYPLYGAAVEEGVVTSGKAWIGGAGGHIRRSVDGGVTWSQEQIGEPFRVRDVFFKDQPVPLEDIGWQCGQFFRMALSTDGGLSWTAIQQPQPIWNLGCYMNAVTFAGNGANGVAVGCKIPDQNGDGLAEGPRIIRTVSFTSLSWAEPTSVTYVDAAEESFYRTRELREAAWAGDSASLEFWAAGESGLILHTTDGGDTWEQQQVAGLADPHAFEIHSVASGTSTYAVFVGQHQGLAEAWFCQHTPSGASWTEVSPSDTSIEILTDVAVLGGTAYAVGQRDLGSGEVEGVVLEYDSQAPGGPAFVEIPGPFAPQGIPECPSGDPVLVSQGVRVLTSCEIDPSGGVWIAGLCGQVWEQTDAATHTWVEHKSQTGAAVRGMHFLSADRGYVAAHSSTQIQQAIVRLDR